VTDTTGQFVYTERENIQGWSYNSIAEVTAWFLNKGDLYYIKGNTIWLQVPGTSPLKYRDGSEPIKMRVRTSYMVGEHAGNTKFFTRMAFQASGEGAVAIGFAANYTPDFKTVGKLELTPKGYGVQAWGRGFYGTYEVHESLRQGVTPNRAVALAVELTHSDLDKFCEVSGIWLEGLAGNMKGIRDK